MEIAVKLVMAIFYWGVPLLIIYSCQKFKFLKKIGEVILAYMLGVLIGHTGLLPNYLKEFQDVLIALTIPLAIPLMLFSTEVRMWFKLAPKTVVALLLGLIALVVMILSGYAIFGDANSEQFSKLGGLLMGVYTGGTPNLAALQLVLNVENETFLAVNAYDMVIGSVYLFFLLTVGSRFFNLFLPKYKNRSNGLLTGSNSVVLEEPMWGLFQKKRRKDVVFALLLALLIFVVSAAVMLLVVEKSRMAVLVLSITTLGIAASFIKRVRKIEKSFELGMYFILVFSLVISSQVNFFNMKVLDPQLFYFMSYVVFGTLFTHAILSMLFRVDTDTLMVCSTAMICSPPFVPVVSTAIGNRHVLVPGLTVGLIGYAIGNYLGVLMYHFLHGLV